MDGNTESSTQVALPKWRSHKTVSAAPIISVDGNLIRLAMPGDGVGTVKAADKMFARYMPVPGDYYVVYDDGYAAISPKKAFEEGYHPLAPSPRPEDEAQKRSGGQRFA